MNCRGPWCFAAGAAGLLLTAATAFGQVSSVYVTAPDTRVICGAQLQLTAATVDRNGNPVKGAALTWSSSDNTVAAADSNGLVTAAKPGFVTITANSGGIRGTFQVQTVPLRIDVTPRYPQMRVGDQLQFKAAVLDLNQQPIPGVGITWQISGSNGFFTAAATIDSSGVLQTLAANTVTVRAVISYSVPNGFSSQFIGLATASILPPADYQLRRLVGTDEVRSTFRILSRRGGIAANDSGQLVLVGALDGVADGVLLNDAGSFRVLASGGSPTFNPAGNLIDFEDPVMNGSGMVAVRGDTMGNSGGVLLLTKDDAQYVVIDGTLAPGFGDLQSTNIGRFSLNDEGAVLFRASYLPDGSTTRATGLFHAVASRLTLDATTAATPPGLTGTFTFDTDYGIDNNRAVYFSAFDGKTRAVFQRALGGDPVKVLATGDALASSTVRSIFRFGVGGSGDIAIGCDTSANNTYLLRYPAGKTASAPAVLQLRSFNQIYAVTAAGVLFAGDIGTGFGLHFWPADGNTASTLLVTGKTAPTGDEIIELQAAAMNSAGTVFAKLRTAGFPLEVVKYENRKATVMFKSGDLVSASANVCVRGQVPGAVSGNPHTFMGGFQSSVFEVDSSVGLVPRIVMGDQLDVSPFYGNLPVRKSPDGTLYVANDDGLFRVSANGVDAVIRVPRRESDGVTQNAITGASQGLNSTLGSGGIAANDNGAVAWIGETNQSHRRLFLSVGGKIQTLAFIGANAQYRTASPAGGFFSDFTEIAIDSAARVMARFTVTGGPSGYFLWDGAKWQSAALFGQTQIPDVTVDNGYELKCAGGDFFAIFVVKGTAGLLARYSAGTWTPVFAVNQTIPTGTFLQAFRTLAVNRAGEVVFYGIADGGIPILVALIGDTARLVYTGTDMTPDGGFILNVTQVEFRDDRHVYFTAFDIWDRVNLYAADPIF